MRAISLVVLLFIALRLYGQNSASVVKLPSKDSIELIKTWKKFRINLESRNKETLRQLSLKTVHCDLFLTPNPHSTYEQNIINSYIPINTFLTQFYHNLPKLWSVMKTKKYHIIETTINSRPPNIKYLKSKSLTLYDIVYVTFEPNEIEKGHEGQSEGFEFVKTNGKFKFFGLTSIP